MSVNISSLLIATGNPGKITELRGLLTGNPLTLYCLADFPDIVEIDETGRTFSENAQLKAVGYAQQTGLHTLADDSGIEVAALAGRPGVLSARYAGPGSTDGERMAKLLADLAATGSDDRRARFVCSIALADPRGKLVFECEGRCEGSITPERRGSGGFGYDPIFVPDGFNETFGELSYDVKQKISHRARAFGQIIPFLRDYTAV